MRFLPRLGSLFALRRGIRALERLAAAQERQALAAERTLKLQLVKSDLTIAMLDAAEEQAAGTAEAPGVADMLMQTDADMAKLERLQKAAEDFFDGQVPEGLDLEEWGRMSGYDDAAYQGEQAGDEGPGGLPGVTDDGKLIVRVHSRRRREEPEAEG